MDDDALNVRLLLKPVPQVVLVLEPVPHVVAGSLVLKPVPHVVAGSLVLKPVPHVVSGKHAPGRTTKKGCTYSVRTELDSR